MKKLLVLAAVAAVSVSVCSANFISEFNPNPSGTDIGSQYVELQGIPGATLPANTWFICVEGGSSSIQSPDRRGEITAKINVSGLTYGSNGLILLRDGTELPLTWRPDGTSQPPDAATTIVTSGTWSGTTGDIGNDAITVALVTGGDWANLTNIDVDKDGIIDAGVLTGVFVHDAVDFLADGTPINQLVYASQMGGISLGTIQFGIGSGTWEPDFGVRLLSPVDPNRPTGGPTGGWAFGDGSGSGLGPWSWNSNGNVFGFTQYQIFDWNNVAFGTRPSPGWRNPIAFDNLGSTILWEGPNSGPLPRLLVLWATPQGVVQLPVVVIDIAPAGWEVQTLGRNDMDETDDIVWFNPSNQLAGFWNLDPSGVPTFGGLAGAAPSADWRIVGLDSVNDNDVSDIVWYNTATRQVAAWYRNMDGTIFSTQLIAEGPDGWVLRAAKNVNTTAGVELFWQNSTTGAIVFWTVDTNGNVINSTPVGIAGTEWVLVGVGTYGGINPSLTFFNTTNNLVAYWNISPVDGSVTSTNVVDAGPTGWMPKGVGRIKID
ncbi:MAG: hypothetical protein ACK4P3_03505 [Fimbriimonadaceae bacterium]